MTKTKGPQQEARQDSKKILVIVGLIVVALALWFFWPRQVSEPPPTPPPLEEPVDLEATPSPSPSPKIPLDVQAPVKEQSLVATKTKQLPQEIEDYPEENVTDEERLERAKVRSQMKAALSAVYTAQRSFHEEFGRYSTDLRLSGWDFEGPVLNFKIGFLSPGIVGGEFQNEDPREMDSDTFIEKSRSEGFEKNYSERAEGLSLQSYASSCRQSCTADSQKFELMAISRTGPNGTPEIWIINEKKELRQVIPQD